MNFNKLIILFIISSFLFAGNPSDLVKMTEEWYQKHPNELPHWMTPEELERKDEIGRDFYETDPPIAPVRNIAEFEPMEAVLIRYPLGIPYSVVAEMSEDLTVTTIVASTYYQNQAIANYTSQGVNLDNCEFLIAPTDTWWVRDYGPWYVVDGDNEVGIVNFIYNRPRPNDNDIPIEVANYLGVELYGMSLIHTGGNYMTDGMGISASSELVWEENPSLSHEEIEQKVFDYLGVETYHVIPDPNNTYIDHIDCWAKFLDVDKILIRSVPTSHSQYNEIEAVVFFFENQISSYGTPYEIYRVYTPNDQPYTNSLILNNKVLVPITGGSWDDEAIESYEEAMPGYEVIGFTGNWYSTDALHCRAKGIADRDMLYIYHIPILGEIPATTDPFEITATIIPYSGEGIYTDSLLVYYKIDSSEYQSIPMTSLGNNEYAGLIPSLPNGGEVGYYIHAADSSGRSTNHPYIGAPDPHTFTIVSSQMEFTIEYQSDWNLLGLPVNVEDGYYLNLFPDAEENTLYSYDSGYILETELVTGIGYWLKFNNAGSSTITGTVINEITIPLNEGWNLITGISFPIAVDAIVDPDGLIIPNTIYGFEDGYVNAETLEPGKGYWIRSSGDGDITISNIGTSGKTVNHFINRMENANRLIFINAEGQKKTLYFGVSIPEDEHLSYSLPPAPISGSGFDVRFAGNWAYCEDSGEINAMNPVGVVDIECIVRDGETWTLVDIESGREFECSGNQLITLAGGDRKFRLAKSLISQLPDSYILHPAYPNPFNPVTTIRYDLPEQSFVTIVVYDMLGREVKELVNGELASGYHKIVWDGTDSFSKPVGAGVYLYQIRTADFIQTNKLLLLK